MKAVILVGGKATRLQPLTATLPKAMVPVLNTPFLEHVIRHLSRHRIKEIILALEADDLFDEDEPTLDDNGVVTDYGGNPSVNARVSYCFDDMLTIAVEAMDLAGEDISRMLLIQYKNYF